MDFWLPSFELDPSRNGLDILPTKPGIYIIMNIVNRRCYVGSAEIVRKRCKGHYSQLKKGYSNSGVLRRDLQKHGAAAFVFICPQNFESIEEAYQHPGLGHYENDWILRLQSHIEGRGYNCFLGNRWTKGAALRDRERKLIRYRSYYLLDGVDLYDPINEQLVESFYREPYISERYLYEQN